MTLSLGLVQRDSIHSEVFGPFLQLCKHLSIDCTVYSGGRNDPLSMLDLFRSWVGIEFQTKGAGEWKADLEEGRLDRVVLITSDEWWRKDPHTNIPFVTKHSDKIIAVHHDSEEYFRPYYPTFCCLVPFAGMDKWIFPIYDTPKEGSALDKDGALVQIGILDRRPGSKAKDIDDIVRYLKSSPDRRVVSYAREAADAPVGLKNFTMRVGLPSDTMIREIQGDYRYVWIPIPKSSPYGTKILTGAIAVAVNLDKLILMPRHLAESYRLTGCVLTYEESIMEIADFLGQENQAELLSNLAAWKRERFLGNVANFRSLLTRSVG
jgi:hypothetical protein